MTGFDWERGKFYSGEDMGIHDDDETKIFKFIVAIWAIVILGSLAILGVGLFIALHFLLKVW